MNGKSYFNTFHIYGWYGEHNDRAIFDYWFQPGIGILKKDYFDGCHEIWKLLDFHSLE